MKKIYLQKHDIFYAEQMSRLISHPQLRESLGLTENDTSISAMLNFIREMQLEEMMGNHYSRMIMNEDFELIGVVTLHNIDELNKRCHISTWLGIDYWGQGYNSLVKEKILHFAFTEMHINTVFAGARTVNFRSRKAQKNLPYMTLNAEATYPEELVKLQRREQADCVLNAVEKTDFLHWYYHKVAM